MIDGSIITFGDSKDVVSWIKCWKLGVNVILENSCTLRHKLDYGFILTYFPYNSILEIIYTIVMPIIFTCGLIFTTVNFCEKKNFINLIIIVCSIINPHTLLLLERSNWDLYIYFSIIILCLSRNYYLKIFLITINSLVKYYPILLIINVFLSKNNINKKILTSVLIFFLISIFIFFHFEETVEILRNNLFGASIRYSFSFQALIKIFQNLVIENNYIYIIFILGILIIFVYLIYTFKIFEINKIKLNIIFFEEKLFILSGNIILFSYLLFNNQYYRDVFILLCLPLLIKISNVKSNFNFIILILIGRYVYNIFTNNFIIWSKNFDYLVFRNVLDFIVVTLIAIVLSRLNIDLIKNVLNYKTKKNS